MLNEWTIDLSLKTPDCKTRKLVICRQAEEEILTIPVTWDSYKFLLSANVLKIRLFDYDANGEILAMRELI